MVSGGDVVGSVVGAVYRSGAKGNVSIASEVEVEMTNLWSLLHSTASGCISIGMWEIVKELSLGPAGTWFVFLTASVTIIHAVHRHRRVVYLALREAESVGRFDSSVDIPDTDGAAVTHEPP